VALVTKAESLQPRKARDDLLRQARELLHGDRYRAMT
jgi:hypothetical protein